MAANAGAASPGGTSTYSTSGIFSITRTDFADSGAGLASRTLTRAAASLAANICGTFGSPTVLVGTPAQSLTAGCYRFTLTGIDNVGNIATVTTVVMVDTTAPTTPTLTFGVLTNAYYAAAGTTLYFRPAAGGTFTVTASSADPETGIATGTAGYSFGSLNTSGGANFSNTQTGGANAYTFGASTTAPTAAATVIAVNSAGLSSDTAGYLVVADTRAPTSPTPTVTAGYYTAASVPVSIGSTTDGGSGVGTVSLQRDQTALAANACGTFPATFGSAVVLSGGNDTSVASGFCYQYRLVVTDKVGNQATSGLSGIARVDTSAPSTPILSFSVMTNVGAAGTAVLARSAQSSGSFTVTVASADPQTGVASYVFPILPASWTPTGSGASRTYAWSSANPTMPSGNQTVTVMNGAGVTATVSFTVVADNTAPNVTNVVLVNGGTPTAIDAGDSVAITFSEQMDASKFCPAWTNTGVQTLNDAVITVANRGGHDEISVTSTSCSALNIATPAAPVNTNANYVITSGNAIFGGTVNWNPSGNTFTITFGTLTSGARSLQTDVGTKTPRYGPPAGLTDVAGNSLPFSPAFTAPAASGF